ncbi:hypothetical protein HD806DRAFT_494655 [Xylariaceae sp. AK1471]|nr:hypothetical protein HD806DRAFT_494655 [Xylariaceae sp. AK1471]
MGNRGRFIHNDSEPTHVMSDNLVAYLSFNAQCPQQGLMLSTSEDGAAHNRLGGSGRSNALVNKQHTEKEWDAMYPHIVRLYLGEQLMLSEVMCIMETRYKFKATQAMYKKRMRRWQLRKYKRRNRPGAEEAESTTAVVASGRGDVQPDSRKRQAIVPIVPRTSVITPPPLPSQLTDVDVDYSVKTILLNLRQISFMPPKAAQSEIEEAGPVPPPGTFAVSQLYATFSLSSTLFARGQGKLAGKAVRKAFLMLEDIVRNEYFGLDWLLIDLLYDFINRGQDKLYATFMAHLANIANICLPHHHPLHRVAEQLLRYGIWGGDLVTLLQRAYFSKVDALQTDPEVRAILLAQNRRVSGLFVTHDESTEAMHEKQLVLQGIRATQYENEMQKRWAGVGGKKKANKLKQNLSSPPPSPPLPPSPAASFTRSSSSSTKKKRESNAQPPLFVIECTKNVKEPDALTLCIVERVYFSQYNPELTELYKLKALSYEHQQRKKWDAAVITQRELLDHIQERIPTKHRIVIRELWALEKLLLETATGEHEHEQELEAIRVEADERAMALLGDIPDDDP